MHETTGLAWHPRDADAGPSPHVAVRRPPPAPARRVAPPARPGKPDPSGLRWPPGLIMAVHVLSIIPLAAVLALATAPTIAYAIGWSPKIVTSGSMAPWMQPGDILLASPVDAQGLDDGEVVVFDAPDAPGGEITHRLVGRASNGDWITKGDANSRPDAAAVATASITGEVRMIIPRIGLPSLWLRQMEVLPLALWTAVLALSVVGVARTHRSARRLLRGPAPRG